MDYFCLTDTALGVSFTPSQASALSAPSASHSTAAQGRTGKGGLHSGVRATVPGWEEVFSWNRQAVALPLPPRQGSTGFTCAHAGPRAPPSWRASCVAGAVLPFPHVLIVPWLVLFTVFADLICHSPCLSFYQTTSLISQWGEDCLFTG